MRLSWSRRAHHDVDAIEDYIAQDNPVAALEVRDKIEAQVKLLRQHPRLGRVGRVKGTRELVISGLPYIVIYVIQRSGIQIARLLHGAQQWPN